MILSISLNSFTLLVISNILIDSNYFLGLGNYGEHQIPPEYNQHTHDGQFDQVAFCILLFSLARFFSGRIWCDCHNFGQLFSPFLHLIRPHKIIFKQQKFVYQTSQVSYTFLVQAAVGYPATRSLSFLWGAISKTTHGFKPTRFSIISRFAFYFL